MIKPQPQNVRKLPQKPISQ